MTRDYCLGFVTNVMLQDGDDHNHDPTVNWRLIINVERLGLTSRNLVVVFFLGHGDHDGDDVNDDGPLHCLTFIFSNVLTCRGPVQWPRRAVSDGWKNGGG